MRGLPSSCHCGLTYAAFRCGVGYAEAYGWQRGSGRSTSNGALRLLARQKRDAWALHLDRCDDYGPGAMDFDFRPTAVDVKRTVGFSLGELRAVATVEPGDEWGGEQTPEDADWTARELEAARILGADLERVQAA